MSNEEQEQMEKAQALTALKKLCAYLMMTDVDDCELMQRDEDLRYVRYVFKGFDISISLRREL